MSSRKGLSSLIAVIILIAIVTVITTMLLNWTTLFASEQTKDISNTTRIIKDCAVINIDDVYVDFASNRSRVFVKSSVEGIMDSAVLINKNGIEMPVNTRMPMEINKGEIKIIEFNLTGNLTTCANFSQVIVSTQCSSIIFDQAPRGC